MATLDGALGQEHNRWASYQNSIYAHFRPPLFTVDPLQWENLAKRKLPAASFYYVAGSAGVWRTSQHNVSAFERYRLRPHMMVNATDRDISIELFGKKLPSPLIAAPIGVQSIVHKDKEAATARACEKLGVPFVLSTAATCSIEEAGLANGTGHRWYQLYWPRKEHDNVTASLLRRATVSGYSVLVLTADTFAFGWRPADLDSAYSPFAFGQGCEIGFTDPVFQAYYATVQARQNAKPLLQRLNILWELLTRPRSLWMKIKLLWNVLNGKIPKAVAWLDVAESGTYRSWDELHILRQYWSGPIVLKGVLTVHDARLAIHHGLDGIIVSNHGGRQVDGAIAALDALAEITADKHVRDSGIPVLFDSGVRTGSDVLKALALGAKAVLLGRPYIWGLALAGQQGVEHVFRCILAEVDITLGLIGKRSVMELRREDLHIVS